jgi:two-component system, OmpR family, sensor histidine kinase MtrB
LVVAFVVTAALAAGVVAAGSYLLVRNDRLNAFQDRAEVTAGLALSVAGLGQEPVDPSLGPREIVQKLRGRRGFEVVVVEGSSVASSAGSVDAADVPAHLEREDPVDGFYRTQADIDGKTYLILSSAEVNGPTNAYFFFHLDALQGELQRLAGILSRAWLAVALLSGLVGLVLARQTLRPVARASQAARSLAEGLLETRLPVEREDEFGAWAVSFNEMADALQEKIEALTAARDRERRFTADVTHELRTPLTGLVGSASMLRAELDTLAPEAKWAAERLLAEVVRIRDLVQELLEISRLEGGHETVSRLSIDSRTFLSSVIRHRSWEGKVEISGDDVELYTDPRRLERIVFNLVDNALKHGGGHVCVSAVKRDGQVEVAVADSGPGIAADDLPHVFDRFYKADPSRSGGTGLGLAIARENARLLGGTISVTSERGSDTTFTLTLPVG